MTCFVLTFASGELFPDSWYVIGVYSQPENAEEKIQEISKQEGVSVLERLPDRPNQYPFIWTYAGQSQWGETIWLSCEERKVDT